MHRLWSRVCEEQWSAALIFLLSLAVTGLAYRLGLSGSIHFDDPHNLGGLTRVVDWPSALDFIASGRAGPTGRPLALATFAAQAYAWPHSPETFLYTNVCLHLLNGVLVAWFLYLLLGAARHDSKTAALTATTAAGLWMVTPLLASTSLMIVQRMALLSATLTFAALVAYLYCRALAARRPTLGIALMTTSVVLGTVLATLAKENGTLLPLMILVMELLLLKQRPSQLVRPGVWRTWVALVLAVPAVLVCAYLLWRSNYSDAVRLVREFGPSDRLLTQAHVLWLYLLRALLPRVSVLGPFHDDHPVLTSWVAPEAFVSLCGWCAVGAAAFAFRKRAPLPAFGLSWFLAAHLLESTTLPLEMYFEHRNYIPLVGPMLALASLAFVANRAQATLFRLCLTPYAVLLATVLFSTTALWGNPSLAAEMWAIYNPGSKRAAHYLAGQYYENGDPRTSIRVFRNYLQTQGYSPTMELQIIGLSCEIAPDEVQLSDLDAAEQSLRTAPFEHSVYDTLERLYQMSRDGKCGSIDQASIHRLAEAAEANPAYRANAVAHHNLHILMATEARHQRNLAETMAHLEQALNAYYSIDTVAHVVDTLRSAGLDAQAEEFIAEARRSAPSAPHLAVRWHRQLASLESGLTQ